MTHRHRTIIGVFVILSFLLLPNLVLTGETGQLIDRDAILKIDPQWQENYDNFQLDEGMLETLRAKVGDNLEIVIYLGTWCSDSKKNLPPFIKIIDALLAKNLNVTYYDVKRKASKDVKYYVEELKIERVPTFIFYRDGEELGRIIENPQNSLIEDFLEIIF